MRITPSTTDHSITCEFALCDCMDVTACDCGRECDCHPCIMCGAWCPEGDYVVTGHDDHHPGVILCPDCYNYEG